MAERAGPLRPKCHGEVRLCALRDGDSSQYSSTLMKAKLRIVIHILPSVNVFV